MFKLQNYCIAYVVSLFCLIANTAFPTMSFTDMFNFYAAMPRNHECSQENPLPDKELPATPTYKPTTKSVLEDTSTPEYPRDSVTKRRRHALYMERPPVWCPGPDSRNCGLEAGDDGLCGRCRDFTKQCSDFQERFDGVRLSDLTQDTQDIASEEIAEEQARFEQELLCDIAAAMTEAQTPEAVPDSDPETPLLVNILSSDAFGTSSDASTLEPF